MSSAISAHYICRYDQSHPLAFYKELAERVQRDVFPEFCINPSFLAKQYHNLVAGSLTDAFVTGNIDYHTEIGDRFGVNLVAGKKSEIKRNNYERCPNLYHRDRKRYDAAKIFAQKYISFGHVGNYWHSDISTRPHSDAVFLVAVDLAKHLHAAFQLPIHTICFTTLGLEYSAYSPPETHHKIRTSSNVVDKEVWKDLVLPWQRVPIVYPNHSSVLRDLEGVITSFDLPEELGEIRHVQQKYGSFF